MIDHQIRSVSFIGAGNVATQLALGLQQKRFIVKQVWSKNISNAEILAKKINAKVCADLLHINREVDLIIISIKDDAIEEVLKLLPSDLNALVHTSGSIDMKVLKDYATHTGVFYPLQSFNKDEEQQWSEVPICIEASNDDFTNQLIELGKSLSNHVEYLNSTQRLQIHIAAIFANNFSNYLFSLAYDMAVKQHLPFSLLIPLIKQTTNRLGNTDPFLLQTGPAKRNDIELMKKHLEQLKGNKEARDVYEFMSNEIIKKDRQ